MLGETGLQNIGKDRKHRFYKILPEGLPVLVNQQRTPEGIHQRLGELRCKNMGGVQLGSKMLCQYITGLVANYLARGGGLQYLTHGLVDVVVHILRVLNKGLLQYAVIGRNAETGQNLISQIIQQMLRPVLQGREHIYNILLAIAHIPDEPLDQFLRTFTKHINGDLFPLQLQRPILPYADIQKQGRTVGQLIQPFQQGRILHILLLQIGGTVRFGQ